MRKAFDGDELRSSLGTDADSLRAPLSSQQPTARRRVMTEAVASYLLGMFDEMGVAVVIVDSVGKALLINQHGHRLLFSEGVMNLVDGCVIASDRSLDGRMQAAIKAALPDAERVGGRASTTIFSTDQYSHRGLFVRVSPLRGADQDPLAILVAVDPRADMGPASRVLQGLFDLTPAESQVAQLLATGLDVAAIARGKGASIGTVRHQVRSIFMKIGVSRQPEAIVVLRRCIVLSSLSV